MPLDYHSYSGTTLALLSRPDIAAIFYARVSGIPYVWATGPLPTAWDAGGGAITLADGYDYKWEPVLDSSSITGITQKTEPKAGLGVSGSLNLRLWLRGTDNSRDCPVLSKLVRNLFRTDGNTTNLGATLTAAEPATLTVGSTAGFAAAGFLYLGLETIEYDAIASPTTFSILNRGMFGSWPRRAEYNIGEPGASASFGPIVADWPQVWEGRVVSLWMAFGAQEGGTFTPFDVLAVTGRAEQCIYQGVLSGIDEDLTSITLEVASLDQLFAAQLPPDPPTVNAFRWREGSTTELFPHNSGNWWLTWQWGHAQDGYVQAGRPWYTDQLRTDLVGTRTVERIYNVGQVANYLANTMSGSGSTAYGPPIPNATIFSVQISSNGSGKEFRYQISVVVDLSAVVGPYAPAMINAYKLVIYPEGEGGRASITKLLGYDATIEAMPEYTAGRTSALYVFPPAPKAPPAIWLPGSYRRPDSARLRVYAERGQDVSRFQAAPGWQDDDGGTINGFLRIDDWGVLAFDTIGTETISTGQQYTYFTGIGRTAQTPYYRLWGLNDLSIEYNPEEPKGGQLVQGTCLTNISIPRALLYLLHSGSGDPTTLGSYDQGWYGSGLALPEYIAAQAEIEGMVSYSQRRDFIGLFTREEARKWLADELRLDQLLCVASPNWSTGAAAALTLIRTNPPQEAAAALTRFIDHTKLRSLGSGAAMKIDRTDGLIINQIDLEVGRDPATNKYRYTVTQRQKTSIYTWGERGSLKLRIPSLAAASDPAGLANTCKALAERILDRYAFPYEVLTLTVGVCEAWSWRPGDSITISSDILPDLAAAGRGMDGVVATIYEIEHRYTKGPAAAKIVAVAHSGLGLRYSYWAPAALLTTFVGTRAVWNVAANTYSDAADPVDLSWFAVGDIVLCYRRGQVATISAATIANVDLALGRVTFTAALPATFAADSTTVMAFGAYNTCVARQRAWVAAAAADATISDGVGTDPAFTYQS